MRRERPVDRAKQGIKRSQLTDGYGIPLITEPAPANIRDHTLLPATLNQLTGLEARAVTRRGWLARPTAPAVVDPYQEPWVAPLFVALGAERRWHDRVADLQVDGSSTVR